MPDRCTAVVFVASSPDHWRHTVLQLLRATTVDVVVGVLYPSDGRYFEGIDDRVSWLTIGSISELINRTYFAFGGHLLVANDALALPDDVLLTASQWVRNDLRVATVSFLSNASDSLSFPVRNLPAARLPDGHHEQSLTETLRTKTPSARPAPIPIATGHLVLISAWALGAVGELLAPASARFDIAIADFSANAAEKGFVNLVDTSTVFARPADIAVFPVDDRLSDDDLGWLLHRHRWLIGYLEEHRRGGDSAFAHAYQVARVKALGLTVLVDGSCFGPTQTGTQVATTEMISALADHEAVANVFVSLPGPVPSYAAQLLHLSKVEARSGEPESFGIVDIAYRPYQPVPGFDIERFSRTSVRTIIAMLDVIAYSNGSYFSTPEEWASYRAHIDYCVPRADAIPVISADVREQMLLHGLQVERERIEVIPLGTTNIDTSLPARCPTMLERRNFGARRFAVMLGVNYHHKNRDLAIAAHAELRQRGFDLDFVLAGPAVPYGSSRLRETEQRAVLRGDDAWLHVLPQVEEAERHWLLSHASLAWYPTSAEGFGFMPFEAALFDVPAVSVGFGPLLELGADAMTATSWEPTALCDVATAFLSDPAIAAKHCAALRDAGRHYSWASHADRLVQLFTDVMAKPKVRR